jgi:hypothetical protein
MRLRKSDRVLLVLAASVLAASACNGDDEDQNVTNQKVANQIVEKQTVNHPKADTRGDFTPQACVDDGQPGSRIDVPAGAVTAVYLDATGHAVGMFAEDLTGTENNRMCPTPPADAGPGGCTPKPPWCKVTIAGQNYCIKATPCPPQ